MNCNGYEKSNTTAGPWGGSYGARWDDGLYCGVREIVISHGAGIDSIQIEYDSRGRSIWSEKHGGSGGNRTDKIKLDHPEEYLTAISGHYGGIDEYSPVVIRSLMFESNRRRYGPFGTPQGSKFSFQAAGCKVVGFHGISGFQVIAIGVRVKPLPPREPPLKTATTHLNDYFTDKLGERIESEDNFIEAIREKMEGGLIICGNFGDKKGRKPWKPNPRQAESVGPWGGNGGYPFDDKVYTGIREIHVARYGSSIVSITVCYDLNGQMIWGKKHGGNGGTRVDKLIFDYPREYLIQISGCYGFISGFRGMTSVVKSLTFYTNKMKYGPFGDEEGFPFSSASKDARIVVGFHGRESSFLDSVGVHVLYQETWSSSIDPFNIIGVGLQKVGGMRRGQEGPMEQSLILKEICNSWGGGPWGGDCGKPWDDGTFSGVRKIFLTKGEGIYSLQVEYDLDGHSFWSNRRGGNREGSCHLIQFEYPQEVLTGISGYYGYVSRDESKIVVKSMTFQTNRRRHGPYGEESGTFFASAKAQGKVVGFHGRSGSYLYAIGVHNRL